MSILKTLIKSDKHSAYIKQRPKLFVNASTPTITSSVEAMEWTLEIVTSVSPTYTGQKSSKTSAARTSETEGIDSCERYLFSRHAPRGKKAGDDAGCKLRIFLCDLAAGNTRGTVGEALDAIQLTGNSLSFVRQALFALQIADMIPSSSYGLDVNKFINFTASFLTSHAPSAAAPTAPAFANYSKIIKDNARLRRLLSPDDADQITANCGMHALAATDQSVPDEDMWDFDVRKEKPAKIGFWVTHKSDKAREGSAQRYGDDRNVYGGLM